MSQGPFKTDLSQSSPMETSTPSNLSNDQMAIENTFGSESAIRDSFRSKTSSTKRPTLNQLAIGLVPILVGTGIFVACTSHRDATKDATVESTTAASITPATPTDKYPDENLEDYVGSTQKGKVQHGQKALGTKAAAHRSPADNVYVVQIGAFRVKQNAEKLNAKLKSAGFPVEMQQIEHSSNGQLFLVRLNPMADRHTAEDMRLNLKSKIDIDSMILALPKSDREMASVGASTATASGGKPKKGGEREASKLDSHKSEIR